jgi:exopolyphosphatase/guanosine-5'-triphosphate,3'-diphosphate pyrophosphatase
MEALKALEKQILKAGHLDGLNFDSISQERQQVLPGGLAILRAVFRTLRVKHMRAVPTALREGVLLDLWGRKQNQDVRGETVLTMQDRFEVDLDQAARVQDTVLDLFDQCCEGIGVSRHPFRNWVRYAAALHEIGLFLGFSGYHKHGAYLLANGELPGFSWQEQRALAALVMGHRGKFEPNRVRRLKPGRELPMELILLLRIARRLHRRRSPKPLPVIHAQGLPRHITLRFPEGWLEERPLTVADLKQEQTLARKQSIQFEFE